LVGVYLFPSIHFRVGFLELELGFAGDGPEFVEGALKFVELAFFLSQRNLRIAKIRVGLVFAFRSLQKHSLLSFGVCECLLNKAAKVETAKNLPSLRPEWTLP
jgi:hypothetical protein